MLTRDLIRNGCIIVKTPDRIHNNYGLEICGKDVVQLISLFDDACHDWFNRLEREGINLRWFHQGRTVDWSYFEFWNGEPYQDIILSFAIELGVIFNFPIEIE